MKNIIVIILCISFLQGCENYQKKTETKKDKIKPAKVELVKNNGKFQLLVNKKLFYIKGAGLEFGNISSLSKHFGNSFRTWRTENGKKSGKEVLDEAYKNGLMVTMGIEVGRERHGFDYNDSVAVKEQFERIKKKVIALKDYPALLIWGIGNELNLRYTNPKVWDAVNDISKMIHKIDSNHITTTMLAGISKKEIDLIKERSTDLDLLSVQVYGDLLNLPKLIKAFGWEKAYMITEWGATGHWEVPKTKWDAPIEENSTLKAANYLKRYQLGIATDTTQCVGSYVFLWGQKQERTPTWYGLFFEDGNESESVDVMQYLWTGHWPKNRTPQVFSFKINNKTAYQNLTLKPNQKCVTNLKIHDFEDDKLNYRWEILAESTKLSDGGDFEDKPSDIKINIISKKEGTLKFKAPETKGAYRLFVYVGDGNSHQATANIPFLVN